MKSTKTFVLAILFVITSLTAGAQRLIPGQWVFSVGSERNIASIGDTGFETSFNKVGYKGKMIYRLSATIGTRDYVSSLSEVSIDTRNYDIYASWGRLWNLYHNRSRSVNLWGGVTVDAGARVRECRLKSYSGLVPGTGFLYGFSPEIDFEMFPRSNWSVSIFARPHLQFYTRGKAFSDDKAEGCFYPFIGLKFNIYMFVGQ